MFAKYIGETENCGTSNAISIPLQTYLTANKLYLFLSLAGFVLVRKNGSTYSLYGYVCDTYNATPKIENQSTLIMPTNSWNITVSIYALK